MERFWQQIGTIVAPQGLEGFVRVGLSPRAGAVLSQESELVLGKRPEYGCPTKFAAIQSQAPSLVVRFVGIDSRQSAQGLCGKKLWSKEVRHKDHSSVLGWKVFAGENEFGEVVAENDHGAGPVLTLCGPGQAGSLDIPRLASYLAEDGGVLRLLVRPETFDGLWY